MLLSSPHFALIPYTTLFRSNDNTYDQFLIYTRVKPERKIPAALAQQLIRVGIARGKKLTPTLFGATLGDKITSENMSGLRSEEHTSELQSLRHLVCRLLLEK